MKKVPTILTPYSMLYTVQENSTKTPKALHRVIFNAGQFVYMLSIVYDYETGNMTDGALERIS